MIAEIQMSKVASYKALTSLTTDKKVNLIYGLNGTGKSIVSDFLYKPDAPRFGDCKINPESTNAILVYNQSFIREHFYEADSLKGIFSLSKENKAAEEKISLAQTQLDGLEQSILKKQEEKAKAQDDFDRQKQNAVDEIWKIKTNYCGGDRVLEYCLDGLKGQKGKLFSHVLSLAKPNDEPSVDIPKLKKDVETLQDTAALPLDELPKLTFSQRSVESHTLLSKAIVGNDDSVVADLIKELENSDWVKEGLEYLPAEIDGQGSLCPFCQERTITSVLVENITEYFDQEYMEAVSTLVGLETAYRAAIESLPSASEYTTHVFAAESKAEIEKLYSDCVQLLEGNARRIQDKLKNPRTGTTLDDSMPAFDAFNDAMDRVNVRIRKHNAKIADRDASLEALKVQFWQLMRWQYDQTISRYSQDSEDAQSKTGVLEKETVVLENHIGAQKKIISAVQKETVNIDQAIENINAGLLDLGIEDFRISKHSDRLYRIVRSSQTDDAFHTLSEGEKMIISFLYFCELCVGRLSADDTATQRIAVIDDPISSLSHIYIFNVGQLIKRLFFQSRRFTQVFVLTHSLYFFYELTDPNHERRKSTQKLFRIVKNSVGSQILDMKYEEIQNDYQSYWEVVNDSSQPPALLANCMRNIVEYFFNFVKRKDLNNVFQMPELQDTKYQAFCRYVNRESHSLGQNIFDLKEFDYDSFKEGLCLVFEKTGYSDHYSQMSRN
ncbi:MAG: AAA family ATPase [Bacteroidales bacterium]|nr:AAA family ATPase [Candidatus Latescibacterota bacterium]